MIDQGLLSSKQTMFNLNNDELCVIFFSIPKDISYF